MGREARRLGAQAAPHGGDSADLRRLVAVVGSSLTELRISVLFHAWYPDTFWKGLLSLSLFSLSHVAIVSL